MKVGDLVKIIAPESVTGKMAGKMGVISALLGTVELSNEPRHGLYVVSVFAGDNIKEVYLRQNEIKILEEGKNL